MSKNKIIIVLLILLSIGIISLYTTYAFEENNSIHNIIGTSPENNNSLIYSIKENSNKVISINAKEEKFIDINLKNTYDSTIRYGMYYYMISPTILPADTKISLSEDSQDALEDIIKPNKTKTISIKISNNSEYSINLIIGALIGFEHGEIEELVTDGEVLIK